MLHRLRPTRRALLLLVAGLIALLLITRSAAQDGELRFGQPVEGAVAPGETEFWVFEGTPGEVIALTVDRLSGDLAPVLTLHDGSNQPVAATQGDERAILTEVMLARPGTYVVRISGLLNTSGGYRLALDLLTPAVQTPTPEPTPQRESLAGQLTPGLPGRGEITAVIYRQLWRFSGIAGMVVDIRMAAVSGNLDPFVSLLSPTGEVIASNESERGGLDAGILAFRLPFTGEYTIVARRAGLDTGRGGTTTGQYTLTLAFRGAENAIQNTSLTPGAPMYGRFTEDIPVAIYRFETGGTFAFSFDLNGAARLAGMRVLRMTGEVIATYQGLSPLMAALTFPGEGPFLLEFSAERYEAAPALDYTVTAYRVSTAAARALVYGAPRRSTAAPVDHWYFTGQAGDIVRVTIGPDEPAPDALVRIVGPQNTILYQGNLGPALRQVFTLSASGLFEIELRTAEGQTIAYTVSLQRIGALGVPFGKFAATTDIGPLNRDAAAEGALAANTVDARWLDVQVGEIVSLFAAPVSSDDVIGLALQQPDGEVVAVGVSQRDQPALIDRVRLSRDGRYRVLIFDVRRGERPIRYTLRYRYASGGILRAGERVKGSVRPENGLALWTISVPAGALINLRLTNLTAPAWDPALLVIDPDGRLINAQAQQATLLGVQATIGGEYRIGVAGQVRRAFGSYELLADVQIPFAAQAQVPIRVNSLVEPGSDTVSRYAPTPPPGPQRVPISDLITPLVSPAQVESPRLIGFNTTIRGEIAQGVLGQAWRFTSGANVVFRLRATSLTGIAPAISLWDRQGRVVFEQRQADGPTTVLTYRAESGGTFDAVVSMGQAGGRYLLTLQTVDIADGAVQLATGTPLIYGQTAQGELLGAEEIDSYYFLGTANDVISVQLNRVTGTLLPTIQLFTLDGREISGAARGIVATLSDVRLPEDGVYTIRVRDSNREGRSTGRYMVYLGLTSGPRLRSRGGGIIEPGQSVGGLIVPGDSEDTWLFQGRQGQRVSFVATGVPSPLSLRLRDTAGRAFAAQDTAFSQSGVQFSDVLLPADGIYRVQVVGGSPGVYTLTWTDSQPRLAAGALAYGRTVNGIFTPGRTFETWVFSGTAGDVVSVTMRYVRGDRFNGGFIVRADNGLALATVPDLGEGARADLLLPFSGVYRVVVGAPDPDFQGASVYALTVNLQDSRARSMGSILDGGTDGQGEVYIDDPEDSWIFGARAGDRVRVSVQARDTFLKPTLELRNPAGEVLVSALAESTPATAQLEYAVPAEGVYVLRVYGGEVAGVRSTGAYLISLDIAPPPIAEIETLRYGESRPGLIADDRPTEFYTFSGQLGDLITAQVTRESGANLSPVLSLQTADGQVLARADSNDGESAVLPAFRLPRTGEYRLVVARYLAADGQTAGRYTIRLDGTPEVRRADGSFTYGQQILGRLNDETPAVRLTFEGRTGEVIGLVGRATSGDLDLTLTVESADGRILAANDDADGTNPAISGLLLPTDGTYTLIVGRVATGERGTQGNYEIAVNRLYQLGGAGGEGTALAYGARAVGAVDAAGRERRYTFSGAQGDVVALSLLHQTDDAPPLLSIQDPAGTVLAVGQAFPGRTLIQQYRLPVTGSYVILIRQPANARQSFSPFALTLDLLSAPARPATSGGVIGEGGEITGSASVTGAFAPGEAAHYWLFRGKAEQQIALNLLSLAGELSPSAILIGPNGQAVGALDLSQGAPGAKSASRIDRLPSDGIYSLLVLPGSPNRSGEYRLTLQPAPASAGELQTLEPGVAVNGTVGAVSGVGRYVFSGQGGQVISVRALATGGDLHPTVQLIGGDGRVLAEGATERTSRGLSSVVTQFSLPATGSYLLDVTPGSTATSGTYRLMVEEGGPLSAETVAAASITYGGLVRGVVRAGETTLWSFRGAAGDVVTIAAFTDAAGGENVLAPDVELRDSGGRLLAQASAGTVETIGERVESALPAYVLPADGRYVIALRAALSVSYSLVVQRRQDFLPASGQSVTSRVLVRDSEQQNGIADADVLDYWSFEGEAGAVVQLRGMRLKGDLRLDMALYGPSGYVASASARPGESAPILGPVRLPERGEYLVVVTRWLAGLGATSGQYSLALSYPPDVSGLGGGHIPVYDRPVTGGITAADPADNWTFDGAAGEVVEIRVAALDGDLNPALELYAPEGGSPIAQAEGSDGVLLMRVALLIGGQYRMTITGAAESAGGYRLVVSRVETALQASFANAAGITYGETKQGELNETSLARAWVFFARAGDRAAIEVQPAPESALDPFVYLLRPDGTILAADDNGGGGVAARIETPPLPGSGLYGVVITHSPFATMTGGAFVLKMGRGQPGAVYRGQLAVGEEVTGVLTPDQPVQEWAFEVGAGNARNTEDAALTVAASVESASAMFKGDVAIVTPDGSVLAVSDPGSDGLASVQATLPAPGRYAVVIRSGAAGAQGQYRLRLSYALAPTGGGALADGQRGYGTVSNADFSDAWRFTLPPDATGLSVEVTRLSGDLELDVVLFDATGAQVAIPARATDRSLELVRDGLPPGTYTAIISRRGGPSGQTSGSYTVLVTAR